MCLCFEFQVYYKKFVIVCGVELHKCPCIIKSEKEEQKLLILFFYVRKDQHAIKRWQWRVFIALQLHCST